MNKRIYLILEVKKRELDSRCLLAIKACLQGYSVMISKKESARFLKVVQNLRNLKAKDLKGLNIEMNHSFKRKKSVNPSIF